jgi:hypothetical protein
MSVPIFGAQSLDNVSTDPFGRDDQLVLEDNVEERQRIASTISSVTGEGKIVYDSDLVSIWRRANALAIQVISAELDSAGRAAPVICHIDFGDEENKPSAGRVADAFARFFSLIGREFDKDRHRAVRTAVEVAIEQKKIAVRKRRILIAGLVAVALLAGIYFFSHID